MTKTMQHAALDDSTGKLNSGQPQEPPAEQPIQLTPKAVEMALQALSKRGTPSAALRLGVRGGGCSGASYAIEFADKIRPHDHVLTFGELRVVVDPKSLVYLKGSILDYEIKLMEHGFKFKNPNQERACGCGHSFSV